MVGRRVYTPRVQGSRDSQVRSHEAVRERWQEERASHYGSARFRGRAADRDPRIVTELLDRHEVHGPVLDVPCGTGRLRAALEARGSTYFGADSSAAMIGEASEPSGLVVADAARLPFADASFEAIVACRLLHHLGDSEVRVRMLREWARVSRRLVVASFWDSNSWHAWRRRVGLRKDTSTRRAISKETLRSELEMAGLRPLGFRHTLRFVSQQAFFAAEKRG